MMKYYVFDLDNTLVYTDALNNESYNFALLQQGKLPIEKVQRITREVIFENYLLNNDEKEILIKKKQEYFIQNIKKLQVNNKMIAFLKQLSPMQCVLWTRAERIRVECILDQLELRQYFAKVFYSPKENIEKDIHEICIYFQCQREELIIYDDEFFDKKMICLL